MSENQHRPFLTTLPEILTGIAAVISAAAGLYIALRPPPDGGKPEEPKCSISGLVFDIESSKPLPGVWVDLYRDLRKIQQRPERLKAAAATTGPDGTFSINCTWVKESQFPLELAVRSRDWVGTNITGPSIERGGEWDRIRIPIRMSEVKTEPLRELSVSHMSKKVGLDWFVVGQIENKSDRVFRCVKLRFKMTTPLRDELKGEPVRDLGFLEIEVRDIGAHESRPYEEKRPANVSYYLYSKEEC